MSLPRRAFLHLGAGLASIAWSGRRVLHAMIQPLAPGARIVRQAAPENLETDFAAIDAFLTPTSQHYVRSHFAVPETASTGWLLAVRGAVGRPLSLSLADLRAMPQVTRAVTMECAGNGRQFLTPAVAGVQWERGAVSTAEWTGVRLSDLLGQAGLRPGATTLVFEGQDRGEVKNPPSPAGVITFHRGLSLDEARLRDVLVAHAINGEPLPAAHGAPARLIVPGCYGMASVKWLTAIEVAVDPAGGYWETTDYAYWDRSSGRPVRRPLLAMQVKSLIARPSPKGQVVRGASVEITGGAWADGVVSRVDVSTDGGQSWHDAELLDPPNPVAWRRWRYQWQVPAGAGEAVLMSRATDARGRTQPMTRNADYGTYVIHHVVPVPVTIA